MLGRRSGDEPRHVAGCPALLFQGWSAMLARRPDLMVVMGPRRRQSQIWSGGNRLGWTLQVVPTARPSTDLDQTCCRRELWGCVHPGRERVVCRGRQRWRVDLTHHRRWRHGAALLSFPFSSYSFISVVILVFVPSYLPMVLLFSAHVCLYFVLVRSVIRVNILPIALCFCVDLGLLLFAPLFGWRFSCPLDWVALFLPPPIGRCFSCCVCPFYAHSQRQWVSERFETPTSKRIEYTSHCHVGVTVLSSVHLLRVVSFGDSQARL